MDGAFFPPGSWQPENCSAGGGGVAEMGFRVGPFVLSKNGCWRRRRKNTPENFFSTNNFPPPHLSSQNDQRDVGIILSHRCWVDPPPPPARQVGHPRPEPPLPSRRPRREGGGVGKMGFRVPPPPPPQSNFLPAQCPAPADLQKSIFWGKTACKAMERQGRWFSSNCWRLAVGG